MIIKIYKLLYNFKKMLGAGLGYFFKNVCVSEFILYCNVYLPLYMYTCFIIKVGVHDESTLKYF